MFAFYDRYIYTIFLPHVLFVQYTYGGLVVYCT